MAWTNISNANLDVGAPIRSIDILALRDNISAQANGDSGAPKQQTAGIADLAITASKMSGNQPGTAPAFASRAWVNFNGTGIISIRNSGNVSSVTDNGTGDYTINFSTAMSDVNYCVSGAMGLFNEVAFVVLHSTTALTTGSVRFYTLNTLASGIDQTIVCVSIIR